MITVYNCADYIITKLADDKTSSVLKLQKLAYYCQAWHLAFYKVPLFNGKFEAWVHGPVNVDLYRRFSGSKNLYSIVTLDDLTNGFTVENNFTIEDVRHIENVLEVYAGLTGTQLEELTHREDPWIAARAGIPASARCTVEIDEALMTRYYAARVAEA